jgi:hypothetical protein
MPKRLKVEPILAKFRMEKLEPKEIQSNTDNDEPMCPIPYRENVLPYRPKFRRERQLPRCVKLSTDKEDPSRARPYTLKADPMRVKDLNESIGGGNEIPFFGFGAGVVV